MCQLCSALGYDTHLFASGATPGSIVSAGPAASLTDIIAYLRTQWGSSTYAGEGTYRAWFGSNVSYSIADFYPSNGNYSESGAITMSAVMKSTARLGFELWDDAIAINLNESVNNPAANITVNYASGTDGDGTYARPFLGGLSSGYYQITAQQIWLNSGWDSLDHDTDMVYGGYGVATIVHEIGHTLGLSHPGTYNAGSGGTISYANDAEFAQDNRQFTIMSYFGSYNPATNSWTQDGTILSYYFPSTPMVYDIAAIQATYGADFSTRAGNSTYGFNITADVAARSANGLAVYSFAQNAHPIFTIWDGGGIDTLDCSGYSANQTISLVAGSYSSIGGMNGNIGIAFNCTIENAFGGSGFDTITGNTGNNRLRGNGGNDTINGDGGTDSAVFSGLRSQYTLTPLGGTSVRVTGPDGTDTLTNVELLVFADQTVSWPPTANHAPVVTARSANVTATAGQTLALSNLFSASDVDGNALTYYVYDSNAGANSGRFMINGTVVPANTIHALTAAQFAQATFVAGATGVADDILVQAFDGQAYSGWNASVKVTVPATVNHAPTVSLPAGANVSATASQSIAVSSLFRGNDSDGDTLTYYLYDSNSAANSGHFVVNGVTVPAETIYQLTAAQFAQARFVTGAAGTYDDILVQTFDGKAYSGWNSNVHVAVPAANHAPTVVTPSGTSESTAANRPIQLAALFSGSDLNGDTLTYYVYDDNGAANSGRVMIGGVAVAAQTITQMTAAQLAQATFVAGASGSVDDIYVQAFDGKAYSGWNTSVQVGVTAGNHAPLVGLPAGASVDANAGQSLALSSLFRGSDVDGNALRYFLYDSNPAANSGHFVVGGQVIAAQTITPVTAAQLAQATFVAGAAGTYDDILVQAFDGQLYSGWNAGIHVFV